MFCSCTHRVQTDLAAGLSHICIVCRSPAMQSGRAFNSAATQSTIFLLHTILCMTGRCHQSVRNLALGLQNPCPFPQKSELSGGLSEH